MLATTGRLLGQDLHDRLAKLLAASRRGVRPLLPPHHRSSDAVPPLCSKCCCPLDEIGDEGSIIVMRCGHCYHNTCLSKSGHVAADSAKCIHCLPEDTVTQAGEFIDQKLAQKNFVQHGKPGLTLTLEQIHSVEEWFELRKSLWKEGTHICNSESPQWKMEYSPARRGTPRHTDFLYGDPYE
ncbi:hypothetical protein J437_LFUL016308 [Ladona fulva]|uniref:RING-type domain-containing protein n=1 Tax=Ladona fulva TaxID=123851 RepID=A0A8K0KIB0_LADFU|nr:hypothetical protein J437_LFUL016308 [Ladona fulva]